MTRATIDLNQATLKKMAQNAAAIVPIQIWQQLAAWALVEAENSDQITFRHLPDLNSTVATMLCEAVGEYIEKRTSRTEAFRDLQNPSPGHHHGRAQGRGSHPA